MKRATILMSCLFLALTVPLVNSVAQQNQKPKAPLPIKKMRRTKPEIQNVYSDQWDSGEVKNCFTYSGQPTLLVCDQSKMEWKGALINMVGDNAASGMTADQAYHRAFVDAITKSKQFMVEFSDSYGRDPTPWPKPQTGRKMTSWDCTKDKTISCSLGAREE